MYDLIFDPNEANNLVGKPIMAEILAELRGKLEQWMQDTKDPLLNGPIATPEGALAGEPDSINPEI